MTSLALSDVLPAVYLVDFGIQSWQSERCGSAVPRRHRARIRVTSHFMRMVAWCPLVLHAPCQPAKPVVKDRPTTLCTRPRTEDAHAAHGTATLDHVEALCVASAQACGPHDVEAERASISWW